MIITDQFVYLHQPKTGGTFVTAMLQQLSERVPSFNVTSIEKLKHAGIRRIPEEFRDRAVVTSIRNTFDHYVSRYTFRWWAEPKHAKRRFDLKAVRRDYPSFPDISFSEFLSVFNNWQYRRTDNSARNKTLRHLDVGHNSCVLAKITQRRVMHFLKKFDDMSDEALQQSLSHVRVLRTESLNDDLADILVESGVSNDDVAFIRTSGRVLPARGGRGHYEDWWSYYTDQEIDAVRRWDRLYFRLFPDMVPPAEVAADCPIA